jgi:hypothetical protein
MKHLEGEGMTNFLAKEKVTSYLQAFPEQRGEVSSGAV